MDFLEWEPIYKQILHDFKFDRGQDEHAAEVLGRLLKSKKNLSLEKFYEMINNKLIYIFGDGPSLEVDLLRFKKSMNKEKRSKSIIIAADGATSSLLKFEVMPDIIVTDLDGHIPDQIKANEEGAVVVIHAHGDNIPALKRWVPRFKERVLGTTQAQPDEENHIYNFGGFTDGDRAIFLASHFKAQLINLVAFNFIIMFLQIQ